MKNKINLLIILCIFAVGVLAQVPWNLDRIDQRTGLDGLYTYQATGQGVRVYIVDSGIDLSITEFEGRAVKGYGRNQSGCDDHGTLTSGIVGSKTFGVAKQAILISVQVKCTGQIQLANLLKGLDWTYRDCKSFQRSGGRCVVNLGEGGRYYYADFNNSVQQLIDLGAVVVGPAGNDADDACHYSPGAVMDTIVVGASRQDDTALLYSNFGACVDLYAPGEGAATISIGGVPTYFSGTSAATPHVSGLAAIYLERHALATPLEVRNAIILDATSDVILGANPNLFINTVMRF